MLTALLVVVVLAALRDPGATGEERRLGGDFPAFYAAGSLARDGNWDNLYDAATQQAAQQGLLDDGGYLYFAYPPQVAALYAPLSALDYRWSYLVHTLLMAAALAGAVLLVRPFSSIARAFPAAVIAALLLTYPLFSAVTGGQNTTLTLLLMAAAARFDHDGRPIASGLAVGLMLYKPQFAAVFLLMLVVRRSWRALAAAGAVGAGFWLVGAGLAGAGWVSSWLSKAAEFARLNADLNSANLISLPGALGHVLDGPGMVAGWVLAAAVGIWLLRALWARRLHEPGMAYAVTAAAAILVLPQPLFYELGLLAVLALVALRTSPLGLVSTLAAATWLQPLSGPLGGLPSTVILLAGFMWAVRVVAGNTPTREPAVG